MFEPKVKARSDLKSGTLYAVTGEQGWLYYGQVTPERNIGFLRHRTRDLDLPEVVLGHPLMTVITVNYPSIGRALRAGLWKKLGCFPLAIGLEVPLSSVQWPAGTSVVTVWSADTPEYDTQVDDPAIQNFEVIAAWEADEHIPARLTADYGVEDGEWHVGGPIWRERRVAEERARRWPDAAWHQLPDGWVPTSVR